MNDLLNNSPLAHGTYYDRKQFQTSVNNYELQLLQLQKAQFSEISDP